jgi:uncharacterized membrane protein YccC
VFIVFLGPATREELVVKGRDRVLGTLAGVAVALPVNHLLGGDPAVVITVVLVSCLLGHFLTHSYALLVFFITVCVFQLYASMDQYETGMLLTRLTETTLGAAVAVTIAALVLPAGARDTAQLARQRFLRSVGQLLDDIGSSPEPERHDHDRLRMLTRTTDEHVRRLTAAGRPVAQLSWTPLSRNRLRTEMVWHTALASRLRGLTVSLCDEAGAFTPEVLTAVRHLAHMAHALSESHPVQPLIRAAVHHGDPNPVLHHLHHLTALLHAACACRQAHQSRRGEQSL